MTSIVHNKNTILLSVKVLSIHATAQFHVTNYLSHDFFKCIKSQLYATYVQKLARMFQLQSPTIQNWWIRLAALTSHQVPLPLALNWPWCPGGDQEKKHHCGRNRSWYIHKDYVIIELYQDKNSNNCCHQSAVYIKKNDRCKHWVFKNKNIIEHNKNQCQCYQLLSTH